MTYRPWMPCLAGLVCATMAQAEPLSFEERVRAYLLENPEVILEALQVLSEREAQAELETRIAAFPDLFEAPPRLGLGPPDAPLRVIEFFDYKCAPCKAMHPVLEAFARAHPGVRIEMRHLPILTPGSERAARFVMAVQQVHGDALQAQVHARLWEVRGPLRREAFEAIAADLGFAFASVEAVMESAAITERIAYNRDAAIALDIFGTPAFVTPRTLTVGSTDIATLAELWLSR